MWSKSYSVVTTEVTKEQIWKLTTDIDNWKNWDDTVEYSKLQGEFKVGECFILKPKGGPKVDKDDLKQEQIVIYLTKEQKDEITKKAKQSSLSVSKYVMLKVFGIN